MIGAQGFSDAPESLNVESCIAAIKRPGRAISLGRSSSARSATRVVSTWPATVLRRSVKAESALAAAGEVAADMITVDERQRDTRE